MKLKLYQVDAFTDRVFGGNPAAVCPLEQGPDDRLMQSIAAENNLSETAFFVPGEQGFELRWFTPLREVDLCGHATLASAHVIFEILGYSGPVIAFETRSGTLRVGRAGERLQMDFPADRPVPCEVPDALAKGLGQEPVEVLKAADYLAVFDSEDTVRAITPDLLRLSRLDLRGVIITAPGREADFVSRFFAPNYGVPEDPVTGSAHCQLAPYWAGKLGKNVLAARQVSTRGGEIACEVQADRVLLAGSAVTFMQGEIAL